MPVDKALALQTLIKGDTRGDTKDEAQAPALAWPAAGNNTRRFDRSAMVSTSSDIPYREQRSKETKEERSKIKKGEVWVGPVATPYATM